MCRLPNKTHLDESNQEGIFRIKARFDWESSEPTFSRVRRDAARPHAKKKAARTKVKIPAQGITNHDFESDSEEDDDGNSKEPEIRPKKKHRDIFVRVIDLQDELQEKIYTD